MSTPAQPGTGTTPQGLPPGLPQDLPQGLPPGASPSPLTGFFHPILLFAVPSHGPAAGGNTVHLFGFGLQGATQVLFGTAPATIVSQDPLGLSITVTAPGGTADTTVTVTVVTPQGTSNGVPYSYLAAPTPSATSIFPTSGAAGAPFVIFGSGLTGATTATFGTGAGSATTPVTVDPTGTFAIGIVPARPAGTPAGNVTVSLNTTPAVTVPGTFNWL